ncbi:MAG: NUDIX domain-containing protein [Crocinitomicaceae bacterium]|nr:NUDIX domain-containing protein [Flavobacteriales bacterium]NQZ38218.1 NUDIX domain-containing protein [Crocinitomicaceae bacterium]
MKYDILKEEIVFDHFFKIKKAKIRHELFDSNSIEVNRLCFERGDSVAILMYEKDTDSLLFTNQFRYPTTGKENGWILELTAGSIESKDDEPKDRAKKEIEEEIGYQVEEIEFISSFFVSPGGTSERILLYYSEVNSTHKVFDGGGMKFESEDIQLVKIKTKEVIKRLKDNQFRDAKTILGIQWFLLNKVK